MPRVNFTADFAIIRRTAEHPTTEIVHTNPSFDDMTFLPSNGSKRTCVKNFPLLVDIKSYEQNKNLRATSYVHFVWFCCSTPQIIAVNSLLSFSFFDLSIRFIFLSSFGKVFIFVH